MKNRTSIFSTIGGLLFFLVLIFYTNTMGYLHVSGFLIFFLVLFLSSFLWGKASLKEIQVQVQQDDIHAFPGEQFPVRLFLKNQKWLPVTWLDILLPLPEHGCVRPEQEDDVILHEDPAQSRMISVYSRKISWLLPHQEIVWNFSLKAQSRGIYQLDHIYLESGDGFGLSVSSCRIPLTYSRQITVYPKRIPADIAHLLRQNTAEAQGSYGYQEDLTLLKNSRTYQYGDNMRRINWRLLARQQELMVNEYETISPQCIGFYLDLESFVTFHEEKLSSGSTLQLPSLNRETLEAMISLVGSCICELTERRIICALLIPAYQDQEARCCIGNDLDYQAPLLLEELARICYEEETYETRIVPADLRTCRSRLGHVYITGQNSGQLHTRAVLEALGSHMVSYLTWERCEHDQRLERPLLTFSELSFPSKEMPKE